MIPSNVIVDASGVVYGVTQYGGSGVCGGSGFGCGTVFKLTPSGSGYTKTALYSFAGGSDGDDPVTGVLAQGSSLYGTTVFGGGSTVCATSFSTGCGTVYRLVPSGSGYTESVIYAFKNAKSGETPRARLIADNKGVLYGTTEAGGAHNNGVVYALSPSGNSYKERVLYKFGGAPNDGSYPFSDLMMDGQGALYGTTIYGGSDNVGSVYKLTPAGKNYTETLLYSFQGSTDGSKPTGDLIADPFGTLYGTTSKGGVNGLGTVFTLTPNGSGGYAESIIYSFQGPPTDGFSPSSGLISVGKVGLYGTTAFGGSGCVPSYGCGTVFKVVP